MSKTNQENRLEKTYRFALYGRPGSGKSCYLAALAMDHGPHPQGFTCEWIQTSEEYPKPQGDVSTWDPKDPRPSVAFHRGIHMLHDIIDLLRKGKVPPGNEENPPFRFRFHLTTPGPSAFRVELIDYSGELLRGNLSEREFALLLFNQMQTMDGILVLAEAPLQGKDADLLADQLWRLKQAFALLRENIKEGQAIPAPVALIVNKWDRRGPSGGNDSSTRDAALQVFLDSRPEAGHRSLVDTLRNSVNPGNFKPFAVSAFGESEFVTLPRDGGDRIQVERPLRRNPLPSFGLEDPFIWAVARRNQIDLHRFANRTARLKWFHFFRSWKLWHRGKELAFRFPESSLEKEQVESQRRRCLCFGLAQVAGVVFSLLVLFGMLEAIQDNARHRNAGSVVDNPNTQADDLKSAEDWLNSYYQAPGWRPHFYWFILGRDQAKQLCADIQFRRDKLDWQEIEKHAPDHIMQLEPAETYLRRHPSGNHAIEATHIVKDGKHKLGILKKEFQGHMDAADLSKAARLLVERLPQKASVTAVLKDEFLKQALIKVKDRKADNVRDRDYRGARKYVDDLLQDQNVTKILPAEHLKAIQSVAREIDLAEDQYLYDQVRNRKTMEAAKRYLDDAPLKRMDNEVDSFKKYLRLINGDASVPTLTLRLKTIEWVNWWNDPENMVTVWCNGTKIIEEANVVAVKKGRNINVGKREFAKTKLTDTWNIEVEIFLAGTLVTRNARCSGKHAGQAKDFNNRALTLRGNAPDCTCEILFDIPDLPPMPELPEWRE